MARETTYAGKVGGLTRFTKALATNAAELPHLEGARIRLETMLGEIQEISSQQAVLVASKQETSKKLKTLVIERGRHIEHRADYTDSLMPWQLPNFGMVPEAEAARDYAIQSQCYAFTTATKQYWVKDSDHPYSYPEDKPFYWLRGYHLGGRSIMWGRQSYRLSPMDFEANAKDGYG